MHIRLSSKIKLTNLKGTFILFMQKKLKITTIRMPKKKKKKNIKKKKKRKNKEAESL